MTDGEMSLAEIGRGVQEIKAELKELGQELRTELRDVRHKANNALQGVQMQGEVNKHFVETFERIQASDERQWGKIDNLTRHAASQAAVDTYKKWLVGVGLSIGGLGIVNLLFNLSQMGGK